jgi:hypothetical protein
MKNEECGGTPRLLMIVLVGALVVRVAAGWAIQTRVEGGFALGDSEGYWRLGQTIAEGKSYLYGEENYQVFRTPGYPVLLAPIVRIWGDNQTAIFWAHVEAALFGTLAVATIWWLGRLWFDDQTALWAAVFAAFYPGAIALSALVLSEAPFCPLMLLELGFWTLAWRARTIFPAATWSFATGLAAGAATLMRPSWLLFTPFALTIQLLWEIYSRWSRSRQARGNSIGDNSVRDNPVQGKMAAVCGWDNSARHDKPNFSRFLSLAGLTTGIVAGLVVAMLPWWIRNFQVTGRFIPTSLQVGASLYDGLSPEANGGSNMDFVGRFVADERKKLIQEGEESDKTLEIRLDRRLWDESVDWAIAHPGQALQLAWVKLVRMWNVWPNEPRLAHWPVRIVVFFTYTPLLFSAIMATVVLGTAANATARTTDQAWPYILCWLPAVYLTALHTVFVSSIRYREPAMLALLPLAAAGMVWVRPRVWKK